jgi:hypothetical protein
VVALHFGHERLLIGVDSQATEAQIEFQKNYPDQAAQLNQLARGMF